MPPDTQNGQSQKEVKNGFSGRQILLKYSRWLILIALLIFYSSVSDTFWRPNSWGNISNIVLQQAPFLILISIGMTITIILKGIDLSVGANLAMSSCITALILESTHNVPLGILCGLLFGTAVGCFNGFLIAQVGVSPFIATYAVQWIVRGIAYLLLSGSQIYNLGPDFVPLFTKYVATFFIIAMFFALSIWFLMSYTTFGRSFYMAGNNFEAAKLSGFSVSTVTIITYSLSGFLAALAGILYVANMACAEPTIGEDFPLRAIAASLIGGTSFIGGEGSVLNAVVGSFIMVTLTNGMIHLGVPNLWQQLVIGVTIVISMIMERGASRLLAQGAR
ncbi:ribose ABC transporter permease [Synergistales bacterium]|nr:ribose ABC transporter permease [Synergistales bacterium]